MRGGGYLHGFASLPLLQQLQSPVLHHPVLRHDLQLEAANLIERGREGGRREGRREGQREGGREREGERGMEGEGGREEGRGREEGKGEERERDKKSKQEPHFGNSHTTGRNKYKHSAPPSPQLTKCYRIKHLQMYSLETSIA